MDAAALAAQIGDDPAVLPLLDLLDGQGGQFPFPERAADQQDEDGVIPIACRFSNYFS
ncbi:hypothetical protein [Terriglobus sp.]|uniref:hypothetical protein n=1 Tax=Terriglobus sp. TaxID=1889013 RepID=UPI003AFF9587